MDQWEINWEDYYRVLELEFGASSEEITDAYRYLANILHPDRTAGLPDGPRRRAEESFKRVNQAFECLSRPESRHRYDEMYRRRSGLGASPDTAGAEARSDQRQSGGRRQSGFMADDDEKEPQETNESGLPLISLKQSEIYLADISPAAQVSFEVRVEQVAGPAFDPSVHSLRVSVGAPWSNCNLKYSVDSPTLPTIMHFNMDLGGAQFEHGKLYAGGVDIDVVLIK